MVLKNPTEFEKEKTIVYFVRHGNRIHIPNSPGIGTKIPGPGLSEQGKKQAQALAKEFSIIKKSIDIVYTSSMKRAIETAKIINETINKRIKKIPALSEVESIVWLKKYHKPKYWKQKLLMRKAIKAIDDILRKDKKKVILIVAHGNIIKGFLSHKMRLKHGQAWKMGSTNCGVTKARFKDIKLDYLYFYNNTGKGCLID